MLTTLNELLGALLQLIVFLLVPFIWWLIGWREKEPFVKWIGLKKPEKPQSIAATLLIGAIAITIYISASMLCIKRLPDGITLAGSQFSGLGYSGIPAAFIYGSIRTGLSEEILFRGFLLKRIANKFGFAVGNTVQALCFGMLHGVPLGIATDSILVVFLMTLLPGGFGWFQGWLNEKRFGGSIFPSWLIHGTMNSLITLISL